jgi:hypothetical protein
MLSLAHSRYTLAAQFAFAAANGAGLLLGTVYNASTPDLYPSNAHHKLGWIVTWVVGTQAVIGLLARVAGVFSPNSGLTGRSHERQSFIPVSTEAMAEHESRFSRDYRFSNDSGQGTERRTESLRSHSSSSGTESPPIPMRDVLLRKEYEAPHDDHDHNDNDFETHIPKALGSGAAGSALRKVTGMISSKVWRGFIFAYNFVDRTILILGFIAICTGVITYGRFFVSFSHSLDGRKNALTIHRRTTESFLGWLIG